jgi:hypothetical protein
VFSIFSKFIKTEYEGGRHDNRIKKFWTIFFLLLNFLQYHALFH